MGNRSATCTGNRIACRRYIFLSYRKPFTHLICSKSYGDSYGKSYTCRRPLNLLWFCSLLIIACGKQRQSCRSRQKLLHQAKEIASAQQQPSGHCSSKASAHVRKKTCLGGGGNFGGRTFRFDKLQIRFRGRW
jgi:hypothetical protein